MDNTMYAQRNSLSRWAPVLLRLIVGYGFMAHGYAKLVRGPLVFAAILRAIGVPSPDFMAWTTILVELVGGLAVLLGAFLTLASVPMAMILVVAMFTVHLRFGFSSIKLVTVTSAGAQFGPPGYECTFFISPASAPLSWEVLVRCRLMSLSGKHKTKGSNT